MDDLTKGLLDAYGGGRTDGEGGLSAALVVSLCSAVTVVEDMAVELRRGSRQRELVERGNSNVWLEE